MRGKAMQKRKRTIHIIVIVLLCIPMTFLWYVIINSNNSPSYKTETITATEPRVYVTTYGKCYHSANCSYLTKSQHSMGKQEAISKGYSACSRCGGKSSGTITVTYSKKVKADSMPKNFWGAIGLSLLCTPLAYLFIYLLLPESIEKRRNKTTSTTQNASPIRASMQLENTTQTPSPPKLRQSQPSIRVGDAVHHKSFGLGIIKKIEGNHFTVRFDHNSKNFTLSPRLIYVDFEFVAIFFMPNNNFLMQIVILFYM